jgi:glutamine cyclotransferase
MLEKHFRPMIKSYIAKQYRLSFGQYFELCSELYSWFYSFRTPFLYLLILCVYASVHAQDKQHLKQCNAKAIQYQQDNAPNLLIVRTNQNLIGNALKKNNVVKQYHYKILNRLKHDEQAFTQGLVIYDEAIFESIGLLNQSEIRKLDIKTGKILQANKLEKHFFAEGLSIAEEQLVQLTWQTGQLFIYEPQQLKAIKNYQFKGEAWGLTTIDEQLIISDGSATLRWLNKDLKKQNIIVHENGIAIDGLNELEYANHYIYANVWPSDCIAKIDPTNGQVIAWINLTGLYLEQKRPHWTAILNGIAFRSSSNSFFVTGKYWPYLYEVKFVEQQDDNFAVLKP